MTGSFRHCSVPQGVFRLHLPAVLQPPREGLFGRKAFKYVSGEPEMFTTLARPYKEQPAEATIAHIRNLLEKLELTPEETYNAPLTPRHSRPVSACRRKRELFRPTGRAETVISAWQAPTPRCPDCTTCPLSGPCRTRWKISLAHAVYSGMREVPSTQNLRWIAT